MTYVSCTTPMSWSEARDIACNKTLFEVQEFCQCICDDVPSDTSSKKRCTAFSLSRAFPLPFPKHHV